MGQAAHIWKAGHWSCLLKSPV